MNNTKYAVKTLGFIFLCILPVLLAGCKDVLESPALSYTDTTVTARQAAVTVVISDSDSRTVFPDTDLSGIAKYRLFGGGGGDPEIQLAEFTEDGTTVLVDAGTWNFTLSAYNEEGVLVLEAKVQDKAIKLGEKAEVVFNLLPIMEEGAGNISISIAFPNDTGITKITASGDVAEESFPIEAGEGTFTYEKNGISAGYYFISFTLYKEIEVVSVVSEMVQVGNTLTSEKDITLVGSSLKPLMPELTANTWAGGSFSSSPYEQWFRFTATPDTQYVHLNLGSFYDSGLNVQLYDSEANPIEERTTLSGGNKYITPAVSAGELYYIEVTPVASPAAGNFRIGLTASVMPPQTQVIALNPNSMADGETTYENSEQWFGFTAIASTQYFHAIFGTMNDLSIQVYDSALNQLGTGIDLDDEYRYAYNNAPQPPEEGGIIFYPSPGDISVSVTTGEKYYIRVRPIADDTGTYKIGVYDSQRIPVIPVLKPDAWVNGNSTSLNREQWFRFNFATGAQQYIYANFGTLDDLSVELYDRILNKIGTTTRLYGTNQSVTSPVPGQIYLMRVTPYSGSSGGTYKIGFNNSGALPPLELTSGKWTGGNISDQNPEQSFRFTATSGTQYIHVNYDTFTNPYVEVYNSDDVPVGSSKQLSGSTRFHQVDVSAGREYRVRVRPSNTYFSSDRGTYSITFNSSRWPPETEITPLTAGNWTENNMESPNLEHWFSFKATSSTQYIHVNYGTFTNPYVEVYDSESNMVGSSQGLTNSTRFHKVNVSTGQTYHIRVIPSNTLSSRDSGTYSITFNSSRWPPDITPLTAGSWTENNMESPNLEHWFSFKATSSTQYIHVNYGTFTNPYVEVYDSESNMVGSSQGLTNSTRFHKVNVSTGQTYRVRVRPSNTLSSRDSGTYSITFSSSRWPPDTTLLTAGSWTENNMESPNLEHWFSFKATSSTQYIHASFGSLTNLYVELYNTTNAQVETRQQLSGSTQSTTPFTVSAGQTYYLRVIPYSSSGSGTYRIGFTASTTPPN